MNDILSYAPLILIALLIVIMVFHVFHRNRHQSITPTPDPDIVGPAGERVVASVGPKHGSLPIPHNTVSAIHQSAETVLCECGHHGPASYSIDAYGTVFSGINNHRWCPECLIFMFQRQTTRCALCGHTICPGDDVALYDENDALPYTYVSTKIGDSFVGCMRDDCCPSGGFFAGHWTEAGFQSAFKEYVADTEPKVLKRTI